MTKTIPTRRSRGFLETILTYSELSKKLRGAEDSIMQLRGALTQVEKLLLAEMGGTKDQGVANRKLAPGLRINISQVIH